MLQSKVVVCFLKKRNINVSRCATYHSYVLEGERFPNIPVHFMLDVHQVLAFYCVCIVVALEYVA